MDELELTEHERSWLKMILNKEIREIRRSHRDEFDKATSLSMVESIKEKLRINTL